MKTEGKLGLSTVAQHKKSSTEERLAPQLRLVAKVGNGAETGQTETLWSNSCSRS